MIIRRATAVRYGRQDVIQIVKDTSSTNQSATTAEPNALRIMTFLITSVIKSTSMRDVANQINNVKEHCDYDI